jgi:hypothetical protein
MPSENNGDKAEMELSREATAGSGSDRAVVWTSRTLLWLPGAGQERESLSTTSIIDRAARSQGLTVLRRSPCVLAVDLPDGGRPIEDVREVLVLETFQGSIDARSTTAPTLPGSLHAIHEWAWKALSFYRLVQWTPVSLRIESDPIDVKPLYWAKFRGGTLLASRLIDLFAVEPALREPIDPLGLYDLVYHLAPGGTRTLHRDVARVPTGSVHRWERDTGLRVEQTRRLSIPEPSPGLGVTDTVRKFDEILRAAIASRLDGAAGDVFTSLSGGFDSRLLSAACTKLGRDVTAVTYGLPHLREAQIAREVARAIGIGHRVIPYANRILLDRLPLFLSAVESQASPTTCQITNLLNLDATGSASLLHGYLVDALSGSALSWLQPDAFANQNAMAEGIARRFVEGDELGEWFARRYGLTMADGIEWVRTRLRDDGEPYQVLTMWNLENRQRRLIASHMALLGPRYHMVTPFYSGDMLRAWLEVPRLGLEGRALLRQMLARLYSVAARIPHAEEIHPIIPNITWLGREFVRSRAASLQQKLPGLPGVRRVSRMMGAAKESNIWRLSYSLTPEDRAEMEAAVRADDQVCQDVLGLSPVEFLQAAKTRTPRVYRIAWAVASYARVLAGNGGLASTHVGSSSAEQRRSGL